jgi:hypothetical protein
MCCLFKHTSGLIRGICSSILIAGVRLAKMELASGSKEAEGGAIKPCTTQKFSMGFSIYAPFPQRLLRVCYGRINEAQRASSGSPPNIRTPESKTREEAPARVRCSAVQHISMPQCPRPCRSSGALGRRLCALCRTRETRFVRFYPFT